MSRDYYDDEYDNDLDSYVTDATMDISSKVRQPSFWFLILAAIGLIVVIIFVIGLSSGICTSLTGSSAGLSTSSAQPQPVGKSV